MRKFLLVTLVITSAIAGAVIGSLITIKYVSLANLRNYDSIEARQNMLLTGLRSDSSSAYTLPAELNFKSAAQVVIPAVVHIRVSYGAGEFSRNPLERFFHYSPRSSGSGVIISDDGYIVTNNHVIEDANRIEVVLNDNRKYFAKVIGTDPSTDLALIKINEFNLPFVPYGNSDQLIQGEWVLAIGNPFDLNSTVTAGIVSAKARNIRILQDKNNLQVESFIQTDAAVNPGNSGGALVNLRGELVGINTAIATQTGSYAGYSFAIPVSLVKKVMDDLLEFGQVQRGLLGIRIVDMDAAMAERIGTNITQGVYVNNINRGSAAEEAGLQRGDIIVAINGSPVNSVSELQEIVARNRPGKEVEVAYNRNGDIKKTKARLKNNEGSESLEAKSFKYELDGATFENLAIKEMQHYKIRGGVRLRYLKDGKWKEAGIQEGFIVTHIDKVQVDDVADLNRILEPKSGSLLVEGMYDDGSRTSYALNW
ncbi:MAG TPA: trypsin-like peptidase domain-containing protein [Cyclobacteriaceae bacterium]|nr:trypsin-like peptidase domain-containing protein [Cyclobacteriaceae bacterium]